MKHLLFLIALFIVLSARGQVKQFEGHPYPNGLQVSLSDTGKYHFVSFNDYPHLFDIVVSDKYVVIMSISSPDSNGVTTVHFMRSHVHFINDSTFTFKQK